MSSTPQKSVSKMCKSPKNSANFQTINKEKIIMNEYENLSTNCTVVGSNNLHLVKKPQIVTSMSPAYSNPSPGYPPSPYSSPASLKSPSPQSLKPPTPQPSFPVMQIIHNSHPLLARPMQTTQQPNIIKLKPHLNILPKPATASPQPSPKPSVSPQIVIPNQQATIMPTAQPLLLNQMPMLAPGVQFILRPQTTKIPTQMQTATATPQGLILQPGGQQLLQLQTPRSQPMVRVLTNGMQLGPPTSTFVTQMTNPTLTNVQNVHQNIINQAAANQIKKKPKKKKQKLDLGSIMKLSGIGDEDDIQFESDASQSESEPNQPHTPQPTVIQQQTNMQTQANLVQSDGTKKLGNIQISAVAQPTINATTPLLQVLNQNFQSGVISNSTSQAATAQASIPFNPFMTPNFTINNGLMVQRSGGFKLTVGEDGKLILQHDPTLNQDIQSQLLLQSIFGLNGGLVLQPSLDQQVHSQTVQTIQQQSVQTIQQQTVQSQTIQTVQQQMVQPQTVQHSLQTIQQTIQPQIQTVQPQTVQQTVQQTIQHQTVQSQPIQTLQQHTQPMQIVQPQPIQGINQNLQTQAVHSIQSQVQPTVHSIQSQVQSLQSQIQGQIQSLLQSQPLQTMHAQPIHTQAVSHSTQSVQTVQPQPVPHQNVQPLQNLHQHQTIHTSQSQPILKVQPFQKSQPPVQTVHPQPIQAIHHQQNHQNENQQPPPTSYVVNLTPDQLEQLKRNGQLTVNGQTIFMQRPNVVNKIPEQAENKKLSPKIKPVKKVVNKIQNSNVKSILQDNAVNKNINHVVDHVVKDNNKSNLITALQSPPKNVITQVQQQPAVPKQTTQPSALVQPSVQNATNQSQPKIPLQQQQVHVDQPKPVQKIQVQNHPHQNDSNGANQDVERLLGQILEESSSNGANVIPPITNQNIPQQRVHTIQLTPQKQEHLKSIQLQIQTLSARLTPGDTEMHNALKLLFAEQQKILASGKLIPPDKVYYHNNQLTIVNPSGLGLTVPQTKAEPQHTPQTVAARNETSAPHQVGSVPVQTPRINVSVPSTEHTPVVHPTTTTAHAIGSRITISTAQCTVAQQPPQPTRFVPSFTKAQLIEQQLNTDQNGAVKPDIHTPFRDKGDACKRLIRYHCFDQPVLSQKDLNKADEIFELTARHFIDKFSRMVDKYRYLLLKESMRQVQTSELMMLDRMFLAEEQQSLIRLRQDLEEMPPPAEPSQSQPLVPPQCNMQSSCVPQTTTSSCNTPSDTAQEEYDEWACIQRELGCFPNAEEPKPSVSQSNNVQPPKRSASSDSRLETLKRFRVEKHNKKSSESVHSSVNNSVQSANVHNTQASTSGASIHSGMLPVTVHAQNTHHVQHIHQHTRQNQQNTQMRNTHSFNLMHNAISQHVPISQSMQNIFSQSTQHIVHNTQQITHTVHHTSTQHNVHQQNNPYSQHAQSHCSQNEDNEVENNSIDEQVQSAIDSILNLQQNTSLDLDDAVSSILS